MTLAVILLLISVILFAISALSVDAGRVNLQSLGLAFFAASFLVSAA